MSIEKVMPMVISNEEGLNNSEQSFTSENILNGIDLTSLSINELVNSNEWQMRIYGYKKLIKEIDTVDNIPDFETIFIERVMKDKNISAQNIGLQAVSKFIDKNGHKILNLEKLWSESISDTLIKKTLYNPKTSLSSTNLAFSFFEQFVILVKGDFSKIDHFWEGMVEFINNNKKSKGIAIKQIFGVVKLFLGFINNYGVEFLPFLLLCKTTASLLTECSDISLKDTIYDIISICVIKKNIIDYISSLVTPSQLKEIQKRVSAADDCSTPLRKEFIDSFNKSYSLDIKISSSNDGDFFNDIEPVDVVRLLPINWLEIISDREIKWSERKAILDKFSNLCEAHKKLAICQLEGKNNSSINKKNNPPTISDYQQILIVLQRIIKCEGNTTLILSVLRLCSNIVKSLRGKLTAIIRPLTTQVSTKLKDQNKTVCNEAINFIINVLKHTLTLDHIFEDLLINGFKEKVVSAKCSAISICMLLIDDVMNKNESLERHYKGFKLILSVIPSLFDDPSVQVRSSASTLLVKLNNECFGSELNFCVSKIVMGLNNAKLKLIKDIEKKMGLPLCNTKEYPYVDQNTNPTNTSFSTVEETEISIQEIPIEQKRKIKNSIVVGDKTDINEKTNDEVKLTNKSENISPQSSRARIGNVVLSKDLVVLNNDTIENTFSPLNVTETPKLEDLPRILHSVSLNGERKTNFFEKLSSKNIFVPGSVKSVYIDKRNTNYFISIIPNHEIALKSLKMDNESLNLCIKPYISEALINDMFGSDVVMINYSMNFWENFINHVSSSENKEFNFTYFLLSWILNNINKGHVLNYYPLIVELIHIIIQQEISFIKTYSNNLVYFICFILVSIMSKDLINFEKYSLLFQNELESYERLIILLIEKKVIYYDYASELVEKSEVFQYQIHSPLLINTVLVSLLWSPYCFEKSISLINNQLLSKNDPFILLTSFGILNIYYILLFYEKSGDIQINSLISNIISHISNSLGSLFWNELVKEFPKIRVEAFMIKCDGVIEKNKKILYDLLIICSLEYETIVNYNILGSTGNGKDIGFFPKCELNFELVNRIFVDLNLICGKVDCILKQTEEMYSLLEIERDINSLLTQHFYYSSQLLVHIYFSLYNKLHTYLKNDYDLELHNLSTIFLKIVTHIDKLTSTYQKIMVGNGFPIKTMMMNTLFIMSNYHNWKEELQSESDKLKLVGSLNNVMGVNIISAFQNDLPKLVKTIIDVIIFGIKHNNQTIFENDLLCRLLPKVLRRIKVSVTNSEVNMENHIESIIYCFENVINIKDQVLSNQLNPIIEFSSDYLLTLHEHDLIINASNVIKQRLMEKIENINNKLFTEKISKVMSVLSQKSNI
ncbi:hypothetical protein FG386_000864 [Cryptosporidium ryanae]|uniref:uncharacterized protein n=1 Tax=Cryptosporidium ryanae TaxID=515981 RepID=UPI00351A40EE|nr:hypothetical protein FG386_000864 [Cryptosporidium ryanae]